MEGVFASAIKAVKKDLKSARRRTFCRSRWTISYSASSPPVQTSLLWALADDSSIFIWPQPARSVDSSWKRRAPGRGVVGAHGNPLLRCCASMLARYALADPFRSPRLSATPVCFSSWCATVGARKWSHLWRRSALPNAWSLPLLAVRGGVSCRPMNFGVMF